MTIVKTCGSVQFGCGWKAAKSWMNFDASPTLRFERIPVIGQFYQKNSSRFPDNVIYGDIVKGLPIAPGSVARLFASHVLEHLSYEDALIAINNSYALLVPGGVFRVIVPDLKLRAEKYIAKSDQSHPLAAIDFMRSTMLGQEHRRRGLRGLLHSVFGGSDHRWMWDEASLSAALHEAGFAGIRRCVYGDSGDPLFAEVEDLSRFIDNDIVELAIECRRPL
jgi:hypothetical protein